MMSSFDESSGAVTTSLMTTSSSSSSGRDVSPDDEIMTSPSHARTICCDVTRTIEQEMMISKSRTNNENVEYTIDAFATVTSGGSVFTSSSSADSNGGLSRDYDERQSVTERRQTVQTHTTLVTNRPTRESALQSTLVISSHQVTREDSSRHDLTSSRHAVTLDDVDDTSSALSSVTPRITDTFANISDSHTSSRAHVDSWLPLALRFSADNVSVSAAVGSNKAANRRPGSSPGLLREEVATVGAAVAGVVVFWSLLAFTMYAIVRMRKRKKRRRLRGSDVDAQTAMMEAMVRAELARGRSRVGDSRVPTYVNVAELIPRSSSSCDLDMSDFFHYVFDSNHSDLHGVWKKQRYNDVVYGRSRDQWQDGSRTIQPSTRLSTTHNNCRQLNGQEDYHCLLNDAKNMANGQLQSNGGVLTRVKSLDSVCKAADEAAVETKHRQRPRRRRVRRSASTSRCLVSANNKPASSANTPANGDVTNCVKDVSGDDDVKHQLPVNDVKLPPRPDVKDEPTDITRIPEAGARHGDKMALPEVSSLGDREPAAVMSPLSQQNAFSSRTCALSRTTQPTHRIGPPPLYRHVPPYRVMTSAGRYPPPPPPPPPLPGHVMRLFSSPNTAGRPSRFPRMGQTGLTTSNSHRMTLQAARPEHVPL